MFLSRLVYLNILYSVTVDIILLFSTILILPYRAFVFILARIFKPHLKNFVTGVGHVFCHPHVGDHYFPGTVTVALTIAGNIDVEDFTELFHQRILQYGHNKDGSHPFQRFQSTIESFMGYWFWTDEVNFNLKKHIRVLKSEEENNSAGDNNFLQEILTELSKEPWVKNQSPWKVTLIPCKNSETLFITRYHHSISDGLSMAKVLWRLLETESPFPHEKNEARKDLQISPKLLAKIPRDTAEARKWSFETFPKFKDALQCGFSFTKPVPVGAIKEIMSRHGTSFQAVLSTVTGSAIQRALEDSRHPQPLPKYVDNIVPLKTRKHPKHMTIDFLPACLPLLVDCSSLKTRLMKEEELFKDMKNSSFPLAQYYRVHASGTLPTWLRNIFFSWIFEKGTLLVSNFPYFGKMTLLGKEVVDMMGIQGAIPGVFDMTILTTGCLNRIRFGVATMQGHPIDSKQHSRFLELEMEKLINLE